MAAGVRAGVLRRKWKCSSWALDCQSVLERAAEPSAPCARMKPTSPGACGLKARQAFNQILQGRSVFVQCFCAEIKKVL